MTTEVRLATTDDAEALSRLNQAFNGGERRPVYREYEQERRIHCGGGHERESGRLCLRAMFCIVLLPGSARGNYGNVCGTFGPEKGIGRLYDHITRGEAGSLWGEEYKDINRQRQRRRH